MTWSTLRWAVLLVVAVMATACGGDGQELPFPAPEGVDPQILAPLLAMGPCPSTPAAANVEAPEGLVLPDAAVITSVAQDGSLATIQGWIDWTPVQLRVHYQHLEDRVTVLEAEDEVFEAEVLANTPDGFRLFVKAQAACEQGSVLIANVAPAEDADLVPEPAGN